MIQVQCQCGKHFKAGDEHAGKRAKCPACGQMLLIPKLSLSDVLSELAAGERAAAGPLREALPAGRVRSAGRLNRSAPSDKERGSTSQKILGVPATPAGLLLLVVALVAVPSVLLSILKTPPPEALSLEQARQRIMSRINRNLSQTPVLARIEPDGRRGYLQAHVQSIRFLGNGSPENPPSTIAFEGQIVRSDDASVIGNVNGTYHVSLQRMEARVNCWSEVRTLKAEF